jgi:hypothetical protein
MWDFINKLQACIIVEGGNLLHDDLKKKNVSITFNLQVLYYIVMHTFLSLY